MNLGNIALAQGFEDVKKQVEKVKTKKYTYTVFYISKNDPVSLGIHEELSLEGVKSVKKTPTKEQVKQNWETFIEMCKEHEKESFFVVYDFGYFTDEDVYRSSLILCSFIPDTIKGMAKMIYSTNVQSLKEVFSIPFLFQANTVEDLNFDEFKKHIKGIQVSF
ncbi:hypothetical protein EHP00_32 [Ecytonucleospora hepatopenaei]|uniref:ADF-H domain-containing protein n=1 Tax=Ecytonucleospora hepatopenaei TaxID=646526 RepID=A0A1W0E5K2_9MICR|nr:hypothetical protein EHP00_32 [Ecytonucleospora hepatopenaei]